MIKRGGNSDRKDTIYSSVKQYIDPFFRISILENLPSRMAGKSKKRISNEKQSIKIQIK